MKTKVGGILKGIYTGSSVSSIKRFKKGLINETYDVKVDGKRVVVRIYPSDFWKAKKEKYLYELLREKTDVPVPEVIALGRDYLVMSKIEGKGLPEKLKSRQGMIFVNRRRAHGACNHGTLTKTID